jgi:tetratricopeptide (TPR) repeat protein
MATALAQAKKLDQAWARKPGAALAVTLRQFYGKHARKLPLKMRAELCLALGEAAELEGRFDHARWLYASAVGAVDAHTDERLYARAVLRSLLNASRLGDGTVLSGVAALLEKTAAGQQTPRLVFLGSFARGLDRFLVEDYDAARRAFEAAMGASWETGDSDSEALAHHLLAQTWSRLGKLARAREHVEAARAAARKANSWILDRRLALEASKYRLRAGMAPEALAEARHLAAEIRRLGFPRFESFAWTKIAQGILLDRVSAQALLTRSEGLLPEGHPDRSSVLALKALLGRRTANGRMDRSVAEELQALVALARG